jgi:adenylate kinase family enzyme
MKNIIIAGCGRNGKTTLARRINEELSYFVISLDKLMTAFGKAYPQLDVRIAWDYEKATANVAPFLGHYLGMLSSGCGYADDLNLRTHAMEGNRFVLEGGHFDFEKITSIMKTYGIEELRDHFILIGLAQNTKTADEYFGDLRKYDTEDDWTYGFNDAELMEFSIMSVRFNREMTDYMVKYGFTIYDTSGDREQVFSKIIEEIKMKMKWG